MCKSVDREVSGDPELPQPPNLTSIYPATVTKIVAMLSTMDAPVSEWPL